MKVKITLNTNISLKGYVIIAIFGLLLGIWVIFGSFAGWIKVNIFKTYQIEIAELTRPISVYTPIGNGKPVYLEYSYNVDGKQYIVKQNVTKSEKKKIYKKGYAKIYYNIENPEKSNIYINRYHIALIGVGMIAITQFLLICKIKETKY